MRSAAPVAPRCALGATTPSASHSHNGRIHERRRPAPRRLAASQVPPSERGHKHALTGEHGVAVRRLRRCRAASALPPARRPAGAARRPEEPCRRPARPALPPHCLSDGRARQSNRSKPKPPAWEYVVYKGTARPPDAATRSSPCRGPVELGEAAGALQAGHCRVALSAECTPSTIRQQGAVHRQTRKSLTGAPPPSPGRAGSLARLANG